MNVPLKYFKSIYIEMRKKNAQSLAKHSHHFNGENNVNATIEFGIYDPQSN